MKTPAVLVAWCAILEIERNLIQGQNRLQRSLLRISCGVSSSVANTVPRDGNCLWGLRIEVSVRMVQEILKEGLWKQERAVIFGFLDALVDCVSQQLLDSSTLSQFGNMSILNDPFHF